MLLVLPPELFSEIFSFCSGSLNFRLVSKDCLAVAERLRPVPLRLASVLRFTYGLDCWRYCANQVCERTKEVDTIAFFLEILDLPGERDSLTVQKLQLVADAYHFDTPKLMRLLLEVKHRPLRLQDCFFLRQFDPNYVVGKLPYIALKSQGPASDLEVILKEYAGKSGEQATRIPSNSLKLALAMSYYSRDIDCRQILRKYTSLTD